MAPNDTMSTLGAGGLVPVQSSTVVMESEDLQISVHKVSVRYVFRNESDRDIDATVAFPLPEINGGALANVPIQIPGKDPLNFVGFQVRIDGKPVVAKAETRAFFYGPEITSELRSLGLPLSPLDGTVTSAVRGLTPTQRKRLKPEWVDCELTRDGKCWPYWQARIQFYWTQRFPANSTVKVEHTYLPVIGGGAIVPGGFEAEPLEGYCEGSDIAERLRKLAARYPAGHRDDPALESRTIEYILTTANNWAGPIRKFRLSVVSDSEEEIVLTCAAGLKRVTPTRYELVRSNFHPTEDLKVLIVRPAVDRAASSGR